MEHFNPDDKGIQAYLERVDELYFIVNEVEEDRRVPAFLGILGSKTYALLWDLLGPVKPSEKTFAKLKQVLEVHYKPKMVVIAECSQFHQSSQAARESVMEYVAKLWQLRANCDFDDYLDQSLWDRIVCGLEMPETESDLRPEMPADRVWPQFYASGGNTSRDGGCRKGYPKGKWGGGTYVVTREHVLHVWTQ